MNLCSRLKIGNIFIMITFQQYLFEATIQNFPQDFEQVLNLVVGGTWTLSNNDNMQAGNHSQLNMGVEATYRGMSENGRHYEITVMLMDQAFGMSDQPPSEYDFKTGSKNILFVLGDVVELGKNFQSFGSSHPSIRIVHSYKNDSFFPTPLKMAQSIKQHLNAYEQQHDLPEPTIPSIGAKVR